MAGGRVMHLGGNGLEEGFPPVSSHNLPRTQLTQFTAVMNPIRVLRAVDRLTGQNSKIGIMSG
jgi:hypothetical protein